MNRSVTVELIRKRTEHHEGLLIEVLEIDLHQDSLTAVGPVLGRTCPNLRRLYLHNNVISCLDVLDWRKLSNLRFLCLALNNLTELKNLERCELLQHLDVSFNLVTLDNLQQSMAHLQGLKMLESLHLLGNPCEREWSNCRNYVIAMLPQLKSLDGKQVLPEERRRVVLNNLQLELFEKSQQSENDTSSVMGHRTVRDTISQEWVVLQQRIEEDRRKQFTTDNQPHQKALNHEHIVSQVRREERNGERRNVNEGGWEYILRYEIELLCITISIPKDVPIEDVDLDVKADFVSVVIQGQVLRLRLPHMIDETKSKAQRSQVSGQLLLELPLLQEIVLSDSVDKAVAQKVSKPSLIEQMHNIVLGADDLDSDDEPPTVY